jgi:hypothetical protein
MYKHNIHTLLGNVKCINSDLETERKAQLPDPCSISVYCDSFYIRHRVPGDVYTSSRRIRQMFRKRPLYEQLPFIYRLKLYTLFINAENETLNKDSDLLYSGALWDWFDTVGCLADNCLYIVYMSDRSVSIAIRST